MKISEALPGSFPKTIIENSGESSYIGRGVTRRPNHDVGSLFTRLRTQILSLGAFSIRPTF